MGSLLRLLLTFLIFGIMISAAKAGSITASPTSIDIAAPAAAAQLTLRNPSKKLVNVQVRVFKWSQIGGQDKLEPTTSVIASPPFTKMAPGQEYIVRVMRVNKQPVIGEESYRVLIDEVPLRSDMQAGKINLVTRQSIPVFVQGTDVSLPKISWTLSSGKSGSVLVGRNTGETRLKLYGITLTRGGKQIQKINGLVGYVLGGSTMSFPLRGHIGSGTAKLSAESNMGPFSAQVSAGR